MSKVDWLYEAIEVEVSIQCSKCGESEGQNSGDECYFRNYLLKLGWKATVYNVYCPKCAGKYLKPKKEISDQKNQDLFWSRCVNEK